MNTLRNSMEVTSEDSRKEYLGSNPRFTFSCVTLSQFLNLSVPGFPHL